MYEDVVLVGVAVLTAGTVAVGVVGAGAGIGVGRIVGDVWLVAFWMVLVLKLAVPTVQLLEVSDKVSVMVSPVADVISMSTAEISTFTPPFSKK